MDKLQRRIQFARGEVPADLVLLNARLVNVCSGECYLADVAIADGLVVGVSADGAAHDVDARAWPGPEPACRGP